MKYFLDACLFQPIKSVCILMTITSQVINFEKSKTKQNKTKQNKTKQNKTKQKQKQRERKVTFVGYFLSDIICVYCCLQHI